jgi:hypothetical protein
MAHGARTLEMGKLGAGGFTAEWLQYLSSGLFSFPTRANRRPRIYFIFFASVPSGVPAVPLLSQLAS